MTGLLNHQLSTALVGWHRTALYIGPGKERELLLLPAALLGSTKGGWSKAGQYKHNKALEKVQVAVGA